ncbi:MULTISPECIES: GntR family transcriptional regulator [Rhodococcus]|uniref:GntR family transcriptional regulator n=1 Tax=Rhodococcus opacus TaxID=37919 RepID=A0A2S8J9U6_RHOOP|nr:MULTISPECIES: GntR family transcriptional regulator [Rhodococcus]PQP23402.1 GntR family transcriptional regulator [Rhodococcus opacus]QSE86069.1 GntR family transcriptional regulator [Rhodococcus koreensis]
MRDRQASGEGAVLRAAASIRELVMRRELLPGQQLRQEDLAQQIGISRGPIREALQILGVDGVVEYERNRGYFVAQFSADEMSQLYLVRDLLESAVLVELSAPNDDELDRLVEINEALRGAGTDVDVMMRHNDRFHGGILELSPQRLVVAEIQRIWRMSVAYRALSLSVLPDAAAVAKEHDEMIDALCVGDGARLVALWGSHRQVALNRLLPILR